jgi:hypothetical protein
MALTACTTSLQHLTLQPPDGGRGGTADQEPLTWERSELFPRGQPGYAVLRNHRPPANGVGGAVAVVVERMQVKECCCQPSIHMESAT